MTALDSYPCKIPTNKNGKKYANYRKNRLKATYAKFGGRCVYCGVLTYLPDKGSSFQFADNASVDHVIPVSRGGAEDPSNFVLACYHCNQEKGSKEIEIFEYFQWDRSG